MHYKGLITFSDIIIIDFAYFLMWVKVCANKLFQLITVDFFLLTVQSTHIPTYRNSDAEVQNLSWFFLPFQQTMHVFSYKNDKSGQAKFIGKFDRLKTLNRV